METNDKKKLITNQSAHNYLIEHEGQEAQINLGLVLGFSRRRGWDFTLAVMCTRHNGGELTD